MVFTSGNRGPAVRSDCWVSLEQTQTKKNEILISSKVKRLYGSSILLLADQILEYFHIQNVRLTIDDKGALPFVIASRIESVIKQKFESNKIYKLNSSKIKIRPSERELVRTSRLYIPGNSPKLMINAGIYSSSGVILDLEDSVHPERKYEARILVRNALLNVDFKSSERMVRINQLPMGYDDLECILPGRPNLILIPKCENAQAIIDIDNYISERIPMKEFPIFFMPIIESALGIERAYEIAMASERNVALAIGLEDYTADIGVERTQHGGESLYARMSIVNAARAAGIQAIDSVFSDVNDMEALEATVKTSKSLGFNGMGCIHPRQVPVINSGYAPTVKEIEKAKEVVLAFEEAKESGLGVVALGSKMIDAPVVARAVKIIDRAEKTGLIDKLWRGSYEE